MKPGNPAHALAVISRFTHTGDFAGKPFELRPWQSRIIKQLFKVGKNGLRQYRTCLMMLPRKNGKTEISAAIALYCLLFDSQQGEIYLAAADRDQASKVFQAMVSMIRNDPRLDSQCVIVESQKRIVHHRSGSFCKAISAEAYSKHGFNASVVIYDELHCAPNRDLWDVLATSQGGRQQPMMIAISTAGFDRHSILWELYSFAKRVQENPEIDPTFLPILYEAPEDSDWTDESVWKACNPALGDFRSLEDMRIACARAKEIPAQENSFRRLFLNQWTEQSERWIDMAAWDGCVGATDWRSLRERMKGRPCYAGLDLSSRDDLTALALVFEDEDDGMTVVPFFWVPAERAERRGQRDRVPYPQWIREGLITATEGNVVDQGFIREDINRLAKEYRLKEVAFDPWNAIKLCLELQGDGIHVTEVRQGFRSMSEPTKHLGALVVGRTLRHGGHPVLRWMASNMVVRADPNGNLAPDKSKVTERIDGIVASIMGIGAALLNRQREPTYQVMIIGGR